MSSSSRYHPVLFWLALLTSVIALVLIGSGGTVTSTGVGMVDETWRFTPFELFTVEGLEKSLVSAGMFIEHSHRQVGFIVGMLALALAGTGFLWETGSRRWLGLGVLIAVAVQGALGAGRILLNPDRGVVNPSLGRDYALIHGFVGQITFVFLVACTLAFSRSWIEQPRSIAANARSLKQLSLTIAIVFLLQLAIAVVVRHIGGNHALITHATLATLILVLSMALLYQSAKSNVAYIQRPIWALAAEVVAMIALGVSAWLLGAGYGPLDSTPANLHRIIVATAHQCLGALTLATSVIITMRVRHHLVAANSSSEAAA
jgi:hypothetical protein